MYYRPRKWYEAADNMSHKQTNPSHQHACAAQYVAHLRGFSTCTRVPTVLLQGHMTGGAVLNVLFAALIGSFSLGLVRT